MKFKEIETNRLNTKAYISEEGKVYLSPFLIEVDGKTQYISVPSLNENKRGMNAIVVPIKNIDTPKYSSNNNHYAVLQLVREAFHINPIGIYDSLVLEDGNPSNFSVKNLTYVSKETYKDYRSGKLKGLKDIKLYDMGWRMPKDWDSLTEPEFNYFTDKRRWLDLRAMSIKNREENSVNKVYRELNRMTEKQESFILESYFLDRLNASFIAKELNIEEDTVKSVIENNK